MLSSKLLVKRLFDVFTSGFSLILATPLLLFIALWIRLDSEGPVFFRQTRVGRGCKTFRVLKFRTMIDREADTINQFSELVIISGRDPRITRSGRFLRSTSFDELPQLWNILCGDMSIVGPRPILPEQLEVIPTKFMARFDVLPGLTGLSQVRGRRSLGWLQQLESDTEYVGRYGLIYDLRIIFRTVFVILRGEGIYGEAGQNWRTYRNSLHAKEGSHEPREPHHND